MKIRYSQSPQVTPVSFTKKRVHVLGIGLLEERHPELVRLTLVVSKHELSVKGGKSVIDDNLLPVVEAPKVEPEDSCTYNHIICVSTFDIRTAKLPKWKRCEFK